MLENILALLQGLLTPVIGMVACYVAWQQWNANRLKLQLDRYDRRLRLYGVVEGFLLKTIRDADLEMDELRRFDSETAEADFLFGPDVPGYIRELRSQALTLQAANQEYREGSQTFPSGYDHVAVINKKEAAKQWLLQQFLKQEHKNVFNNYLNVCPSAASSHVLPEILKVLAIAGEDR